MRLDRVGSAIAGREPSRRGYLFHWVRRQAVIDTLMAKNTGARMPRADMSILLDMPILLPPLEEQRQIVGLLDRAAEIRRRVEAARAKARARVIHPTFDKILHINPIFKF